MRGISGSAESCASDSSEYLPVFFFKHYFLVLHVITLNVQKPSNTRMAFNCFWGFASFVWVCMRVCVFHFFHPYHNLNLLQLLPPMRTGLPTRYGVLYQHRLPYMTIIIMAMILSFCPCVWRKYSMAGWLAPSQLGLLFDLSYWLWLACACLFLKRLLLCYFYS